MKKLVTYALSFSMLVLLGCRDESLSPLPGWDPGVHAFGVFDGVAEANKANIVSFARNFPKTGQDQASAALPFKIRWVSLDNMLTVNKVEIYVDMIENYTDPDGNPKSVSLGSGGKLVKTISPAAGNRQWSSFTISPTEVYNLYKDATVKYDKVNAVKVFSNPANARPTGKWFNGSEYFVMVWRLYTTDGQVFTTWNPDSICGDPTPVSEANANCSLTWDVK